MGASDAVALSTRLNEIGFPEFTAKLINDVFDAIVTANLNQTKAYLELVEGVSKTISQFAEDTKDSIGGDLVLQFLNKVLPDQNSSTGTKITSNSTNTLTSDEATALNNALIIPGSTESTGGPADTTSQIKDLYKPIIDAVAKRIAADKYTILTEMVKLGILRLVVEDGEIETKLTFTTYGSNFYQSNTSKYNRSEFEFAAKAKTGSFISNWINASASTSYSNISVTTANQSNSNTTTSTVQIYGGVKIKFKTDYQALS